MKKIILVLIILIISIFSYAIVVNGFSISEVTIASLEQIKNKNDELDNKIAELNNLKNKTYPKALSDLSAAGDELLSTKKEYLSLVDFGEDSDIQEISEYKKYEIEALWVMVGNYATDNNLKLNFSIAESSTGTPNMSDIIFEGSGEYTDISDFIADLEKDDKLNFAISDFELEPTGTQNKKNRSILSFKFNVKDVSINLDNVKQNDTSTNSENTNSTNSTVDSTQNNSNTTNTNK